LEGAVSILLGHCGCVPVSVSIVGLHGVAPLFDGVVWKGGRGGRKEETCEQKTR
jgi:hypothetical protein